MRAWAARLVDAPRAIVDLLPACIDLGAGGVFKPFQKNRIARPRDHLQIARNYLEPRARASRVSALCPRDAPEHAPEI